MQHIFLTHGISGRYRGTVVGDNYNLFSTRRSITIRVHHEGERYKNGSIPYQRLHILQNANECPASQLTKGDESFFLAPCNLCETSNNEVLKGVHFIKSSKQKHK